MEPLLSTEENLSKLIASNNCRVGGTLNARSTPKKFNDEYYSIMHSQYLVQLHYRKCLIILHFIVEHLNSLLHSW